MPIRRPDTPLAPTVSDTIKKKPIKDILAEKREARRKLDSIVAVRRANVVSKKDSIVERNAAAKGMTREEYNAWVKQNEKKKDVARCDTSDPNFNSGKSCGVAKAGDKANKRDWKKK
jgi:hypothetical protein